MQLIYANFYWPPDPIGGRSMPAQLQTMRCSVDYGISARVYVGLDNMLAQ